MPHFSPGDHLQIWCGGFWHHGIAFGDGRVIHMSGITLDRGKTGASVRWGTEESFAGSRGVGAVTVRQYGTCDPPRVVLVRALGLLGRSNYNVISNNCEQVAAWCKTGKWVSEQVESAKAVGLGLGGGAGTAATGVAIATAAGASGAEIMSSLAAAGSVVGGGAAAGVVVLASAPAVVATAAVHHGFRDDPCLPHSERVARTNARVAGTVGAVGGALGTVGAISAAGISGLSAAGITTGLVGIGGTMVGGVVVALLTPLAAAGAAALLVYGASRRRR
jgi:hypothetical protein